MISLADINTISGYITNCVRCVNELTGPSYIHDRKFRWKPSLGFKIVCSVCRSENIYLLGGFRIDSVTFKLVGCVELICSNCNSSAILWHEPALPDEEMVVMIDGR